MVTPSTISLIVFIVILVLAYANQSLPRHRCNKKLAPRVKTLLPWLGGALEYARNVPQFVSRCGQACGRNFRVVIGGRYMVFISDQKALHAMFRNREHLLAVGELRSRMPRALGGVASGDAAQVLEKYLLPVVIQGNTDPSVEEIGHAFNTHIYARLMTLLESTSSEQGLSLRQFTSGSIAHAVCTAIWGPMFPSYIIPDLAILDENSYSLALSLPFLPSSIYRARQRSQQALVDFIRKWEAATDAGSATGCSAHGNAVLRALRESSLSGGDQAGLLVAYMFAILSNTMRITFWLLAHLMHDRDAYKRLQDEAGEGTEELDVQALLAIHPRVLSGPRFRLLHSAVKEVARLHSLPSSAREVQRDMEFPTSANSGSFWALSGDVVIANSLAVHMDEDIFHDPHTFCIDRFLAPELSAHFYLWGKGEHICPGRHLAYYLMKMFAVICLSQFEVMPVGGLEGKLAHLPLDDPHSLTTTRPTEDVIFILKPRSVAQGSKE